MNAVREKRNCGTPRPPSRNSPRLLPPLEDPADFASLCNSCECRQGRAQVLLPRGEAEAVFECGMWTDWWPRRILASMSDLLDLARERMEAFNRRRWRCAQAACPPGPRSIRLAELRRRRWDSRYGGGVVHWMTVGPVAKAGRSTAVTRVSRGRPPGSATVRPWRAPTWTWFVRR
jgi:hypothetical protein